MSDQNTPPAASPPVNRTNRRTTLRSSLPTLPLPQVVCSSELGSDDESHASNAGETGSTAGPEYISTSSSCVGDNPDSDEECTRVPLFDDVDEIVNAASALAGPGDYYDLDQLPLLDPLNAAQNASTTKKRKRSASIIIISDSENESLAALEEFSNSTDQDEKPAPKRRNPAHISSYTPNTRTVLRLSKNMFREKVLVNNAFPSRGAQARLGLESWEASRISLPAATAVSGITMFDDNILQILTNVICVTRASVKREASQVVMDKYSLKNPADVAFDTTPKSARIFNKAHVELLQKDYQFIYGPFGTKDDGTLRQDVPFAHPSLSHLIYRAVYAQTLPLERGRYDPMPLPLVALAATAMYAALDDWSSGRYIKRSFTTAGYASHYEHLLAGLKEFQHLRPCRCAALLASYTAYCKNSDPEFPEPHVSQPKLRVCNTDTEDDSDHA